MKLKEKAVVMTAGDMDLALRRVSGEILERNRGREGLVFIGIQRRGVYLASRVRARLIEAGCAAAPLGELDITLYRDDIRLLGDQPVVNSTSVPCDIGGKRIVLVDDVLYTGRTVRAALEALSDLGRPACVRLLVLIDRGCRELPIQPDYLGKVVPTSPRQTVEVRVSELDGRDEAVICEPC